MTTQEHPPAPVVTIMNPSRPDAGSDVLGDDRQRWQPSRPLVAAVLVFLLLLMRISAAVSSAQHRAAEKRLDAAASQAVALRLLGPAPGHDIGDGRYPLGIVNAGEQTIRVLSAKISGPGFESQPIGLEVASGQTTFVRFAANGTCDPANSSVAPGEVAVEVQTMRQTMIRVTLPLPPEFARTLLVANQAKCGHYSLAESVDLNMREEPGATTRQAPLRLTLVNTSTLPLQVLDVRPVPGLSAALDRSLPLSLQPQDRGGSIDRNRAQTLHVRLTVRDCATFRAMRSGDDPAPQERLAVTVSRASAHLSLFAFVDDNRSGFVQHAHALLLKGCR